MLILLLTSSFLLCLNDSFSKETIRIGMASNFSELSTVSFNPYGGYFRDGVQMALEHSAKSLNKKSLEINLVEFDYGADDLNVIKTVKKAVASNLSAVIGYSYSSNALIAASLHVKARLPMLSPSASANRLETFGRYVHLGSFSNQFMAKALAKFAYDNLKYKTIVLIPAANCAYCVDLAQTFKTEFGSLGGQILKEISVLQEEKSFTEVANQLQGLNFDAVFLPNQELTSARLISSIIDAGIKTVYLGADGWGNEGKEFFNVLRSKKFVGYSVTHWHPSLGTRKSKEFVDSYKRKFSKVPNDTSVLAYDYMTFLIQAILKSKKHDPESLENTLQSIDSFEGVTGKYLITANKAPRKDIHILNATPNGFRLHLSLPGSSL